MHLPKLMNIPDGSKNGRKKLTLPLGKTHISTVWSFRLKKKKGEGLGKGAERRGEGVTTELFVTVS